METVTYINGIITYRGYDYPYEKVEVIDDVCAHVHMGDGIYALVGGETEINGVLQPDSITIKNTLEFG